MTLVIDLSPEEELDFRRIAESVHLDAEDYAAEFIRRLVRGQIAAASLPDGSYESESAEELDERIRRMHTDIQEFGFKSVPFYPDEVMTRDWIYGDHP